MFCPRCGSSNPDKGKYCINCGDSLVVDGTAPAVAGAPNASGHSEPIAPGQPIVENPPTSGKAVASLICGIFGFILPASIAAVILGHLSLSEIRKSAGRIGGAGIATAGLVLGYIGIAIIPFVLIVAAIAIPNLLRARIAANEASAVGTLRTIDIGATTYAAEYKNGFPPRFEVLGGGLSGPQNCDHASLLDDTLIRTHRKSGYVFTYIPSLQDDDASSTVSATAGAKGCTSAGATAFEVTAEPAEPDKSGRRSFYTDQTGVIRYATEGRAAADSPPLQ
jgi:type IV pilus assembly protein PilA